MRTIKLKGTYIKCYDSIDQLPIDRFKDFNRFALIDAIIGSDLESLDSRMSMVQQFNDRGDKEKVNGELTNMRMCIHFIVNNLSPKMSAFFATVHSINNQPFTDLSEDNIQYWTSKLSKKGLTIAQVKEVIGNFKKKVDAEMEVFFPKQSDSSKLKNYYAQIKQRTLMVINNILGQNLKDIIAQIDDLLFEQFKPKNMIGAEGVEVQMIKAFEEMSLLITKHTGRNAKEMTTLEFYQAYELLNTKNSNG